MQIKLCPRKTQGQLGSPPSIYDFHPLWSSNSMKKFLWTVFAVLLATSASVAQQATVSSPAQVLELKFELKEGIPIYQVYRFGQPVILESRLGLQLKDGFDFSKDFILTSATKSSFDETWEQVWGEQRFIRNHYNELNVKLTGKSGKGQLELIFRVYDDGLGFRYRIPRQEGLNKIEVMNELTEFKLTGNHRSWSIPAFQPNRYEYAYTDAPLSEIPYDKYHTPLTLKANDHLYLSFHEAALIDYSSMALQRIPGPMLKAALFPWSDGILVKAEKQLTSPWRTVQITDSAAGLIDSYLILNLNEPAAADFDASKIKPGKYVGIWWEMHLDVSTWGSGKKHGANTANTRRYIDFAAKHGFDGVLVEGWNVGWDGNWYENGDVFSFTKPLPDFDMDGLAAYARERGTRIIGHHETSGGVDNYVTQLEEAYSYMHKRDIRAVKIGYVAHSTDIKRTDENGQRVGEWHHGQYMVRHFQNVVDTAAKHNIMINGHEMIKDTGLRRTYPNLLSRECAKGQEYNAWGGNIANPVDHTVVLPFTRLLAGPMDYTPGIFNLTFEGTPRFSKERVRSTLAQQLALYVVFYSPLQMAADLPQHYEARLEAFQFIKDVPVDWTQTRVIHAEIGDYITLARKDRKSEDWYVGSITDEHGRLLDLPLSFLAPDLHYTATIYCDALDADWKTNPHATTIQTLDSLRSDQQIKLRLAPGGGTAIRFSPMKK